jgi:hypothetical protein
MRSSSAVRFGRPVARSIFARSWMTEHDGLQAPVAFQDGIAGHFRYERLHVLNSTENLSTLTVLTAPFRKHNVSEHCSSRITSKRPRRGARARRVSGESPLQAHADTTPTSAQTGLSGESDSKLESVHRQSDMLRFKPGVRPDNITLSCNPVRLMCCQ